MVTLYIFDSSARFDMDKRVGIAIRKALVSLGHVSLPIHVVPMKENSSEMMEFEFGPDMPLWSNDDIIFVHHNDFGCVVNVHWSAVETSLETLLSLSAQSGPRVVLFGGGGMGKNALDQYGKSERVYAIAPPINDIVTEGVWKSFLTRLFEAEKNAAIGVAGRLLSPTPYPEALVAAYLLLVAKSKDVNIRLDALGEKLWEEADNEYPKSDDKEKNINWRTCANGTPEEQASIKTKLEKHFSDIAARA